jgi:hypothetical protein
MFRPHSEGLIDAQDAGAQVYRTEESSQEESRKKFVSTLQEQLLSRTALNDALKDFWELKEDYWPDVSETYRDWLAAEISRQLGILNLEKNVYWKESTLWEPSILPFFLLYKCDSVRREVFFYPGESGGRNGTEEEY